MPTDPICGMFVPESSDLHIDKDGQRFYFCSQGCMDKFVSPSVEQSRLKRKLIVAWSLAVIVILIQYLFTSMPYRDYVEMFLSIPVLFYSGSGFFQGAYHTLKARTGNMDLLVALGTSTAFFFSAFITIFPAIFRGAGIYFDAAVFIITLILTGGYIENLTKARANSAAARLKQIIPETVHLISGDGTILERKLEDVKQDDRILCRPGDIIPVDGHVLEGTSEVDQSLITGEQMPVVKTKGDAVTSGTANLNGTLEISVERVGSESTLNQVYQLIQSAAMGRVQVQRIADIFSSIFIPVVIAAALASAIFWSIYLSLTGQPMVVEYAVLAFVSVVVIACPCAIGLAGPITLLISSSSSSENGILLKNTGSLERLSKATLVVFDKTGTLTLPDPQITRINVAPGYRESDLLALAAAVEQASNHPIARSIVREAEVRGLTIPRAAQTVETPGVGISGTVNGMHVEVTRSGGTGSSGVSVRVNGIDKGSIALSYELRESASSSVSTLKGMGLKVSMITGDSADEAHRIAGMIGIDDIHAECMPQDKAKIVSGYQEAGEYVIFVGDGINDSISLETADAGIAMGSGLDIARESGDIILLNNDLSNIPLSILIGRSTISKIKQNIGWAVGYNSALIPIAGGILVPVFGLSIFSILPFLAALAMGMSSTSVVLNSMRLRKKIMRSANEFLPKSSAIQIKKASLHRTG
ncbi:MAG: heavy metal translocating P-type ATPase [Thermoplasmataceae archaeon]|jgi:Cu+-exporting ATPase